MNLIKRIKNLWRLSESEKLTQQFDIDNTKANYAVGHAKTKYATGLSRPMAQIIKRKPKDPIEEVIKHENESQSIV